MNYPDRFIVKVNFLGKHQDECVYWTLNGSTTSIEEAYVFTWATMPDLFKSSLRGSHVEIIGIK